MAWEGISRALRWAPVGLLTVALMVGGSAVAAPDGSLDPEFGIHGVARALIGAGMANATARSVVQQADGKLVVAGYVRTGVAFQLYALALARLNPDGSPDSSFGNGGVVTAGIEGTSTLGQALIQQADGKLVLLARPVTGPFGIALLRYHADGSPDATFGDGGIAFATGGAARALAQQPDGKLVVATEYYNGSNYDFGVVRLDPNGGVDAGFGGGGVVSTAVGTGDDQAYAIAVQPDGKIVVAGSTTVGGGISTDFAVVRYLANGALDASFGTGGKVVTAVSGTFDAADALVVAADGTVVAAGWGSPLAGTGPDYVLARYRQDGSLDSSFGNAGIAVIQTSTTNDQPSALVQLAGGGFAVAGYADRQSAFGVARLTAAGQPDAGFGVGGVAITDILPSFDGAFGLVEQADGRLVAAGYATDSRSHFAVVRYLADGSLDPTFDGDGVAVVSPRLNSDWPHAIALQEDQKIVAVGRTFGDADDDFGIARFNADGSLDADFGDGGHIVTRLSAGEDLPNGVVVQPDGKLVVVGKTWGGSSQADFALVRYEADGTVDAGFGNGGVAITPVTTNNDTARALIRQPDGKLIAGGDTNVNSTFALVRYTTAGALDPSFGAGGIVTTGFSFGTAFVTALALQPDGKIIAAGYRYPTGQSSDVALARYNPDGSLDPTFGSGGRVQTSVASGNEQAQAVAVLADGRIVVAGWVVSGGTVNVAALRYLANGVLDPTFGTGGIVTTTFGSRRAWGYGLVVQSDGKLVVGGALDPEGPAFGSLAALFRYRADGSLDPTFGSGGVAVTSALSVTWAQTMPLLQSGDGALVLAGPSIDSTGNRSFALARFQVTRCGDGTVAGDETCDDENTVSGDCCDASCQLESEGSPCADDAQPCTLDQCDDGGVCTHPAGRVDQVCRPAVKACDAVEVCDGVSPLCPPDAVLLVQTLCRPAAGACDLAEACDGVSPDCPPDARATDVCRPAGGGCDVAERCDGVSVECPPDTVLPSQSVCRASAGVCDVAEVCDGTSAGCPPDERRTVVCRPASGVCDVAEVCDGATVDCPVDRVEQDGTSCADGLFCNGEEVCVDGACQEGSAPCPLGCDETSLTCRTACPPVARLGCRAAGRSTLFIKRKSDTERDALTWKWLRGEATAVGDFGDPLDSTGYALCIFGGQDRSLLADGAAVINATSTSWRSRGATGFDYIDSGGAQSGIRKLLLRAGTEGRARVLLKGKGSGLPDPPLPIDVGAFPLTVQLINSQTSPACWESTFDGSAVHRNDAGYLKADTR